MKHDIILYEMPPEYPNVFVAVVFADCTMCEAWDAMRSMAKLLAAVHDRELLVVRSQTDYKMLYVLSPDELVRLGSDTRTRAVRVTGDMNEHVEKYWY